jgi:hypothetical protein
VLARCAPDLLADLGQRKLQSFSTCPAASRYWSAIHATDQFVLADGTEAAAVQDLRLSARENDESHEAFATNQLLILELRNLSAPEQMSALIEADLKQIFFDVGRILRAPTPDEVEGLVIRFRKGTAKQQRDLLILLSLHPIAFNDTVWAWVEKFARVTGSDDRGLAFKTLARADPARFGRILGAWDWSWSTDEHFWVNHYGSGALIEATPAVPFDQLAPRLAPWRLLEAVRRRGADPAEVRLAASIFGHILADVKLEEPDPGSTLWVDRTIRREDLFVVSIQPRSDEGNDPFAALRAAMNVDARKRAQTPRSSA